MAYDVEGFVEAVRKDKRGILVNGEWYSSYNPVECEKGDGVAFNFKEKGRFKNIVGSVFFTAKGSGASVSSPGPKGKFPIGPLDGQRSIIRQNAVTNARELYVAAWSEPLAGNPEEVAEEIIKIAKIFESYTAGDRDWEDAKEAFDKLHGVVNDENA